MIIKLTYFKQSGKYYTAEDMYILEKDTPLYEIWAKVEQLKIDKKLPGLMEGHSDFIVLVDAPEHPHNHPHLIL